MFVRSFKPGDLVLFNLACWFDPVREKSKLPIIVLLYETAPCGQTGWFCMYLNYPERKIFAFNSELIKI